jgi:integrase
MRSKRMPGRLNLLTVREVQTAGEGDHNDGGGLLLRVHGNTAAWVFRYTAVGGKRRPEMGLGVCDRNNAVIAGRRLTSARELAQHARSQLQKGIDPIAARRAQRQAARDAEEMKKADSQRDRLTLARAARAYHERVVEPIRTTKHAAQWIASLERNVPPALWEKPVADIGAPELFDAIADLQARIPETASRVRQRLETIFDDCVFRMVCAGNPAAAIRRKLREVHSGRGRGQFAALPFAKAPAFMDQLRKLQGIAARCLEFAVLCCARTGEAIAAEWSEFDLALATWTIPGKRMKGGEAHVVCLCPRAIEIVKGQVGLDARYVFPTPKLNGKPLSNMALLMQLRRMKIADETTVHGLCRATFSTWANELGIARSDVIEACLAHQESDRVRRAYNRAQFNTERKALLQAWSDYLDGRQPGSNVTILRAA